MAAPGRKRPTVLYVLGSGRSGSTIIGIALGSCEGFVCAGELHLWLGKSGRSPLPGEARREFWAKVREQVEVPDGFPARGGAALEKTSQALDPRSRLLGRRLRACYGRIQEQLFAAVASTAGATHVVDTSHFPRRARELQRLDGIDLHLLYVVRDAESVVASYAGDDRDFPRFGVLSTNAYLWLTHLLALPVFLRHPREKRLLVRYEAFAADPEGVLREILEHSGSDAALPDLAHLRTGVAFQGNSLLRRDSVAFERRPTRPPRRSRLTALLHAPWHAVFARLQPRAEAGGGA